MISTLTFEHGETTCFIAYDNPCRFLGVARFGTRSVCMLFGNEQVFADASELLQRCDKCMELDQQGELT